MIGQHQRAEHQREPEILAAEAQPGEGEGGQRARHDVADDPRGENRQSQPVGHPNADSPEGDQLGGSEEHVATQLHFTVQQPDEGLVSHQSDGCEADSDCEKRDGSSTFPQRLELGGHMGARHGEDQAETAASCPSCQ